MIEYFFFRVRVWIKRYVRKIMRDMVTLALCIGLNLSLLNFAAAKDDINWKQTGKVLIRAYQDIIEKSFIENKQAVDARLKWDNEIQFKDDLFVIMNMEGRAEKFWGGVANDNIDIFAREAFIESRQENYSLSFGRQTVTWGKLDDFVVLDRMTPQDFKWFALFDKQERKLPTLMLKHNYYAENWKLETLFLPGFEPSEVDFFGSDWAVFGQLKEGIERDSYSAVTKSMVRGISIEDKDNLTDQSFKNSQFGVRLGSRIMDVDYALYYMYIYNPIPTLREKTSTGNTVKRFLYDPTLANLNALASVGPSATDLTLEKEYPRTNIIGMDWETVLGAYGLRGELGIFFDLPYLRGDFSYVTKDALSIGIGADHTTENNLYFNVQLVENYIFDYEDLFAQEKNTQQLTGTLKKDYLNGNLVFNFDWAWNISHRDSMFNPEMKYKFENGVDVALGGFIFDGALSTVLGRYSAKDLLYLEIKYQF